MVKRVGYAQGCDEKTLEVTMDHQTPGMFSSGAKKDTSGAELMVGVASGAFNPLNNMGVSHSCVHEHRPTPQFMDGLRYEIAENQMEASLSLDTPIWHH